MSTDLSVFNVKVHHKHFESLNDSTQEHTCISDIDL